MTRRIKVEPIGDFWRMRNNSSPEGAAIRLKGKWLRGVGFNPGGHAEVRQVAPGVMELRFLPPLNSKYET